MTSKINESGYSLLQKTQFYIGNGERSIISGLLNAAFIKYYTDFIEFCYGKMVRNELFGQ